MFVLIGIAPVVITVLVIEMFGSWRSNSRPANAGFQDWCPLTQSNQWNQFLLSLSSGVLLPWVFSRTHLLWCYWLGLGSCVPRPHHWWAVWLGLVFVWLVSHVQWHCRTQRSTCCSACIIHVIQQQGRLTPALRNGVFIKHTMKSRTASNAKVTQCQQAYKMSLRRNYQIQLSNATFDAAVDPRHLQHLMGRWQPTTNAG